MNREERARHCQRLLMDPVLSQVISDLEKDAIEVWAGTDLSDVSKREISFFQLLGVRQLRQTLVNWSRETDRKGDR